MRRMMFVLTVAAIMAAVMSVSAPVAFAKKPENEARDALCKNGEFAELGFKNQGQCVSAVNHGFTPPPPPPPEEECEPGFEFFPGEGCVPIVEL